MFVRELKIFFATTCFFGKITAKKQKICREKFLLVHPVKNPTSKNKNYTE
jgi:hypothetical protein